MLSKSIKRSKLLELWERDQKIAYGLTLVLSRSCPVGQYAPLRALLDGAAMSGLGDSALHQCASLGDKDARDLESLWDEPPQLRAQAQAVMDDLRGAGGVNHQVLAAKGMVLLLESHLSLERFTHWAERLSPEATKGTVRPHAWSKGLWRSLRDRASNRPETGRRLADAMSSFSGGDPIDGARVAAICAWYDAVHELYAGDGVPAALTRLGFALLSAQFCWPVQIATNGAAPLGIALPLYAWLRPSYEGDPANRVEAVSEAERHQPPARGNEAVTSHGFTHGNLRWSEEWHQAMRRGLQVGKDLWKSQTGRMDDPVQRHAWNDASLCVDFSIAGRIVAEFPAKPAAPLTLVGSSAQVYWTQVVLGLLLPAHRVPLGTATGTVLNCRNREYVLGEVLGLEAKLKYASQSGFLQKMVLPRTPGTQEAIAAAFSDEAIRDDLLESNLCSTVRDAADALQASGWRRAVFLSTPEARYSFSQLTHDLFELEEAGVELAAGAPGANRTFAVREAWHRATSALDSIRGKALCKGPSPVQFVARDVVDDKQLGYWLGSVDHRVRSSEESGYAGPGLGIACVRTRSGESDMRFWSHVFQLLEATDSIWETFQFGTLDQSAAALAQLLNNFSADPAISGMPAPDLLVIVDEAGTTREGAARIEFTRDTRGSLSELLASHATRRGASHLLADRLVQRDERRAEVFGKTRILVIEPPASGRAEKYDWREGPARHNIPAAKTVLDALRVFRSGFSVHQARAVIDTAFRAQNRETPTWVELRNVLDKLRAEGKICYGRGEFYFSAQQLQQPADPEFIFDADLHEAAALAFAPLLRGSSFDDTTRGMAMTAHHLREADWHFQQVYAYAATSEQFFRAREHLSLMGFVLPVQDWDTVRRMGYAKKHYGTTSFDLACDLIRKEAEAGSPPSAARFAQAINAATQALAANNISFKDAIALLSWVQKFIAHHDGLSGVKPAARTFLYSEQTFFIQRLQKKATDFGWSLQPGLRTQIEQDLRRLTDQYLTPAVRDLNENPAKFAERSSFPLQHGWLMNECDRMAHRPRDAHNAWRYLYAACATDLNASPDSWVRLMAAFPSDARAKDYLQVLHLWEYRVENKTAFAMRMVRGLQRRLADGDTRAVETFRAATRHATFWRDSGTARVPQAGMANELTSVFDFVARRTLPAGQPAPAPRD